jgi:hypothetical protein
MSWLLLAGAVVQTILFVGVHESGRQLIYIDIGVAGALIVAHELLLGASLSRSLIPLRVRPGVRRP